MNTKELRKKMTKILDEHGETNSRLAAREIVALVEREAANLFCRWKEFGGLCARVATTERETSDGVFDLCAEHAKEGERFGYWRANP